MSEYKTIKYNTDGTVKLHKSLIYPTVKGEETAKMRRCSHRYTIVIGSGKITRAGAPTWVCPFCKHKVISN